MDDALPLSVFELVDVVVKLELVLVVVAPSDELSLEELPLEELSLEELPLEESPLEELPPPLKAKHWGYSEPQTLFGGQYQSSSADVQDTLGFGSNEPLPDDGEDLSCVSISRRSHLL